MSAAQQRASLRHYRRTMGERMDGLRRARELEVNSLCASMGWHKSEYSRKYRGITPLLDHEIVMLREILNAPAGWPAVSVEEGLLLEALGPRAAEVLRKLQEIVALLDRG